MAKRHDTVKELTARLHQLAAAEQQQLEKQVADFEYALAAAVEEQQRMLAQLALAVQDEQEYCTSWNPMKRWMCREVRARAARTRSAVEPVVRAIGEQQEQLRSQVDTARRAFEQFKVSGASNGGSNAEAVVVRAALAEQQAAVAALTQALELNQAKLAAAIRADLSPWAWLRREFQRVGLKLVGIVVLFAIAPLLQRLVAYFWLMPLVQRARPLRLVGATTGRLTVGEAHRSLSLLLAPGEACWARADYVRPVEGQTRSQWLLDWRAPFVSYAAGLSILTKIQAPEATGTETRTTLASPQHSDSYLLEVHLNEHAGLVFHPRRLVAVIGQVQLWTTWRIWSWHAWATGQLRFIGVRGSGRCVLEGFGDVVAVPMDGGRQRIEQELVVAFDAQLEYATARTETFLPYLLGRTPLVDDVFMGHGLYVWQKNANEHKLSFTERSFDLLFGAIGKLLGF